MDNQQAFNTVVQHLRTQGAPSETYNPKSGGNLCVYRHPDGVRRCAVGVLIPDEYYTPQMENKAVGTLQLNGLAPFLRGISSDMLVDLQDAHDWTCSTVEEWRQYMEEKYIVIAERFGLTVPPHPCAVEQVVVESSTKVIDRALA